MTVVVDSANLIGVDILFDQLLSILDGPALSLIYHACRLVGYVFPDTNIHIL